jgi:hypothetical protein
MPEQESHDPICPDCGGSGSMTITDREPPPENMPCWCAGLGWIPYGIGLFEFQ